MARTDWTFLKRPLFWVYGSAILIQGLGFFFPVVFLPSYASSLGMPAIKGALLVAIMSVAQVLGQFAFGYMSDKHVSVSILAVICCIATSAASLTLWGLGKSMAFLVVFSLIYGLFGFGFGTMRVAMGRAVGDDPSTVFATYAIFVFLQGVGNILVGPISDSLMSSKPLIREGYGAVKFEGVIILTGASSFLAAMVMMSWHGYKAVSRLL